MQKNANPVSVTDSVSAFCGVKAKLPVMTASTTDVISFFSGLEKVLQINAVPKEAWAKLIPTTLNERCMRTYAKLSVTDCSNYDVVKAAIFDAFKANSHTYLQELTSAHRTGKESYAEYCNRLIELQNNYLHCQKIDSF